MATGNLVLAVLFCQDSREAGWNEPEPQHPIFPGRHRPPTLIAASPSYGRQHRSSLIETWRSMNSPYFLLLEFGFPAIVAGISFALYIFLARERVRLLREIRTSAVNHSCAFSLQRGYRDPAVFRIQGETFSGMPWNLQTGRSGNDGRCAQRLELTFPTLSGKSDLVVMPRDERGECAFSTPSMPEAREFPIGLVDFDAAYKVLAAPGQMSHPPLTPALAERLVKWPKNTVAPNPVAAWRDQGGFHLEAHLSKMSNWATIEYLLILGEDICAQLPAPAV